MSTPRLLDFLKGINPIARENITSLYLFWSAAEDEDMILRYKTEHRAFQLLGECRSLKHLLIMIDEYWLTGQYVLPFSVSTAMKQLPTVRGLKNLAIGNVVPQPFLDASLASQLKDMLKPQGPSNPVEGTTQETRCRLIDNIPIPEALLQYAGGSIYKYAK